ncbi:hypothetical protein TNIN_365781 [Trichonephila inaurata madagascariensis]|uniref:Uncharacterized protein n=1 Tax=Trichonephila inaurata madagascariensis TaxID=2747483 RepID=A0A8X6YAZ9_9ARAC|nr:hypothetical protein TNIN_365781 [Trichonephila inaurata madagascariensis]
MAASQRIRKVTPVEVEKVSTNKKSRDEFSDASRDDESRNNRQKQGLAPEIEKTIGLQNLKRNSVLHLSPINSGCLLFETASQVAILLNNGNEFPSVPITHAAFMKEICINLKQSLEMINSFM